MNKYVWIMALSELMYNSEVIKCFPSDSLDIYIRTHTLCSNILSERQIKFSGLAYLRELGYRIYMLDNIEKIQQYDSIIMNSQALRPNSEFHGQTFPHARCLMTVHAVDSYVTIADKAAAHWALFSSQRQAEMKEDNKISASENSHLFNYIMSLPTALHDEFSYSGPYHIGKWAQKRSHPKKLLQEELAETFHFDFAPDKPIVAFLRDEFCHEQQVVEGLRHLAPHVNLVVKGRSLSQIPGIFVYPDIGYAPNLLRFAADYILAGYFSGTLASSTMLGLPVIPYYTPMITPHGQSSNRRARYTYFLDRTRRPSDIRLDILETVNPPLNLQNTEELLARFADTDWWAEYSRRLPTAQQAIFGNYTIDDAAEKTAALIKKVFEQGTFGVDTTAVRLRPEAGRILKTADDYILSAAII